ncbi:hypothetical protein E2562_032224 [Oryza meyeriana var. granulata]|uniref:Sulfotransferase n=1 Tax=Oryza meyeriana var. granulata TaxID=110450 RepID=A0A6G1D8U8_9ORYZ|nr:hypothetical protein E2562_032224 [Oryza meyeriana var. granulata]
METVVNRLTIRTITSTHITGCRWLLPAITATMASTTDDEPIVMGPVPLPFNNNVGGDVPAVDSGLLEEYESIISSLPSNPKLRLQCYQGGWLQQSWVPGIVAIQRGFVPRRGDVVLASPPKCGTTWLKALAFATMARAAHPPAGDEQHRPPLLNPHDCVPFMEKPFAAGLGSRMDALPSPRLMAAHMHHSILPASITISSTIPSLGEEKQETERII